MTDRPMRGPNGDPDNDDAPFALPDGRVTAFLRERHAPPADERYWDSLEREILARVVVGDAGAWWAIPPRWARAGLVAAGLALAAAGLAFSATRRAEAQSAFDGVMSAPVAVEVQTAAQASGDAGREATLYFLISH